MEPFLWKRWYNPLLFGFWTLEDGTDRLYQNVGKELPLVAA